MPLKQRTAASGKCRAATKAAVNVPLRQFAVASVASTAFSTMTTQSRPAEQAPN
jgi:hypothetical protein